MNVFLNFVKRSNRFLFNFPCNLCIRFDCFNDSKPLSIQ
ncbi:unnamed protein product [Schistosoma margrebowiei]|uniref:Uncharacterized protein n=1 Tax=Schistosoma margrebowiei TaxID=48269 RepID=A0A3P8AQR7_9TREM|nr:unnamed protein product [Schistosoma margrebowiei]